MIQKHVRGWLAKKRYIKLRNTALGIQRYGRGLLARRLCQFLRETRAATNIQKVWRGYQTRKNYAGVQKSVIRIQSAIRGFLGRRDFRRKRMERKTTIIQSVIRSWIARKNYKRVMYGIVKLQGHYKRRKAKAELKRLKIEAKSVEHIKNVNKGLENKIIQLQQKLDTRNGEIKEYKKKDAMLDQLQGEITKLRSSAGEAEKSSNRITELEEEVKRLRKELSQEREEKQDLVSEKNLLSKKYQEDMDVVSSEKNKLKEELDAANRKLQEQEMRNKEILQQKMAEAKELAAAEIESERSHHQRLVKEHNRLQQRIENMKGEMQVLTSPTGHMRTPSDISMISLESVTSSVSPEDKKEGEEDGEKDDQGYGTERKKKQAPPPPTASSVEQSIKEASVEKGQAEAEIDVGLVLKLQNKIKVLERERDEMRKKLDLFEDDSPRRRSSGILNDSAFDALKQQLVNADDVALVIKLQKRVKDLELTKAKLSDKLDEKEELMEESKSHHVIYTPYDNLKMQELQNENDKLKREVAKLMASIASTTNFDSKRKITPAGKEFLAHLKNKNYKTKSHDDKQKILNDQFEAMTDELERRREECLQLRALLAEKSISTHAIAKQSYGGNDDLVNEDNELTMAYKSQRDIIRLLEDQLQKAEKDLKKKDQEYQKEIKDLRRENEKAQKVIGQKKKNSRGSLSLTPEAKIEATMQHEITRLTSENLDLREVIDEQSEQIRKLKKMLKVYAKRLKEGDAAEIQAELEKEEATSVQNVAQIKHRDRNYMGMLEYKKEDEGALIKTLILELKPKVAAGLLPGLPAYVLFMCVRHTDYINDDEKVRSLLTGTINGIKKVVKRHHDDLDRVALWLANTCRFLHTLKQYSGEKAFQAENTSRQNEHCLRNFDLAEYRQVFSDLAVWIYQTLIKLMEATIQPSIVGAVLEHEAIAGLTGSKPSGLRGRTGSRDSELPEHSLDSLMKSMNQFIKVLTVHAVDPELVKQIFKQLYYFLGASALNNLLLRKDMCNWSKGMQMRYNLSHLEQWLRDNKLQESGATTTLEPIIQASQLLQARKTEADVESVCDMCSKLTVPQIVKILNLYTPVDEFEERVPIVFIRKIQERLKSRNNTDNSLLMDLKFSYSVTFPFNPSKISLETVECPKQLQLEFLTRL